MNQIAVNSKQTSPRYASAWLRSTLILLLLSVISGNPAAAAPLKKENPPPLVGVNKVTEQDVHPLSEFIGHVEAIQSVTLQARISGALEQVQFKEGSEVHAGDLLYVIEPETYQQKVAVSQARLARAAALKKEADQHLKRIQTVGAGGVPLGDIEAAEAAASQAEADRQEAQALLDLARIDLDYTRIFAPISGRIGATALTRGNLVSPTTGPLAQIVQLNPIRVQFAISENELAGWRTAQSGGFAKPRLRLADGQMLVGFGKIDFIDNRVDPTTGSIAVRARFDNPDGLLLPGQYVTLITGLDQPRLRPVIPQAAVLEDREGRYVLLVNGQNQVEQRRITTGVEFAALWAVERGLNTGELVIVEGLQKVHPGQSVKTTIAAGPEN